MGADGPHPWLPNPPWRWMYRTQSCFPWAVLFMVSDWDIYPGGSSGHTRGCPSTWSILGIVSGFGCASKEPAHRKAVIAQHSCCCWRLRGPADALLSESVVKTILAAMEFSAGSENTCQNEASENVCFPSRSRYASSFVLHLKTLL